MILMVIMIIIPTMMIIMILTMIIIIIIPTMIIIMILTMIIIIIPTTIMIIILTMIIIMILLTIICSDDETVDVAGSEEEETDSEREPSAEAFCIFYHFIMYSIMYFNSIFHPELFTF